MLGVAVLAGALTACSDGGGLDLPPVTRNLPVTLGDQSFTLVDGIAEKPAAAGQPQPRPFGRSATRSSAVTSPATESRRRPCC